MIFRPFLSLSPGRSVPRNVPLFSQCRARRGVALVLVLSFLVLITALTLAFFSMVSTELSTAKTSSDDSATKQLADSTTQYVMGAIRKATGGDSTTAWASQPGMIRTYDSTGNPAAYYKLYSSDNMTVASGQIASFDFAGSDLAFANGAASDWSKQKAIFTDLNSPVTALDPSATGGTRAIYPIVDPTAQGVVPGFAIDSTSASTPVIAGGNLAPMPVKWIYVLRDGMMTGPTGVDSTGHKATWTAVGASNTPSASNPIVGRIAFWTDDETCKVNINTASEGSYWDTPRTYSGYDFNTLSYYQPVQHEYQRYPGHPATTSLSAVFSGFTNKEDVYKIVPRTTGGGSADGTQLPASNSAPALAIGTARLYASTDELMFQPGRTQNDATKISKRSLEQTKFFLTASSRAPDVNLFGKPRVSLWPITLKGSSAGSATAMMTPFDQLISFCSTINLNSNAANAAKSLYYFQRYDNNSATTDLPSQSSGITAPLYRNRTLLEYLRTLASQKVPGFGSSFLNKYGSADTNQILTEMFDYIRATNLRDSSLNTTSNSTNYYWQGQYTWDGAASNNHGLGQVVPIVDQDQNPANGEHPRGFGRFPTLEQGTLMFIVTDDSTTNPQTSSNPNGVAANHVRVQAAFFPQFFDPSVGFCLTLPWFTYVVSGLENLKWRDDTTGVDKGMGFDTTSYATGTNSYSPGSPTEQTPQDITRFGGSIDPRAFLYYPKNTRPAAMSNTTGSGGTQIGDMSNVAGKTFHFTGGDVTVELHAIGLTGAQAGISINPAVQTITLHFPDADFPVPKMTGSIMQGSTTYTWNSLLTRFQTAVIPFISSDDTVRSVVASPGDMRLNAAHETQAGSLFQPHPNYQDTGNPFAHTLYDGIGRPFYGATGGKLVDVPNTYLDWRAQYTTSSGAYNDSIPSRVSNLNSGSNAYQAAATPHVVGQTAVTVGGAGTVPGDWDNGLSNIYDGPYINKADEGTATSTNAADINKTSYFYLQYASQTASPQATFFSPNRLVQSAVEFGSLPSGVWANKSWQTLLFRPGPGGHPGLGVPSGGSDPALPPYSTVPDHLWLDLFNMPIVEPYAISEPLSTAGRINMNYQMAPFTYITRNTGIRAVLKSEKILAIPDSASVTYGGKQYNPYKASGSVGPNIETQPPASWPASFRQDVNLDATLAEFQARFDKKDLFRSASEICSIDLVPADAPTTNTAPTRAAMDSYWSQHRYTGDNSRERPYGNVYPRLTTKSNTFTVHLRVQTLQQSPATRASGATNWTTWDEDRDLVASEYRGSQTIERYVDPSDPHLTVDYAASPNAADTTQNLESHYKFRVLVSKQFAP